jgi:hypothetical protein
MRPPVYTLQVFYFIEERLTAFAMESNRNGESLC